MTCTIILYQPSPQQNVVIHNYGACPDKLNNLWFAGEKGEVQEKMTLEQSVALTGMNQKELAEVINYLNNTK